MKIFVKDTAVSNEVTEADSAVSLKLRDRILAILKSIISMKTKPSAKRL
jgi:hypothetical protein